MTKILKKTNKFSLAFEERMNLYNCIHLETGIDSGWVDECPDILMALEIVDNNGEIDTDCFNERLGDFMHSEIKEYYERLEFNSLLSSMAKTRSGLKSARYLLSN